jgi:hypothetical protein
VTEYRRVAFALELIEYLSESTYQRKRNARTLNCAEGVVTWVAGTVIGRNRTVCQSQSLRFIWRGQNAPSLRKPLVALRLVRNRSLVRRAQPEITGGELHLQNHLS